MNFCVSVFFPVLYLWWRCHCDCWFWIILTFDFLIHYVCWCCESLNTSAVIWKSTLKSIDAVYCVQKAWNCKWQRFLWLVVSTWTFFEVPHICSVKSMISLCWVSLFVKLLFVLGLRSQWIYMRMLFNNNFKSAYDNQN